MLRRGKRLYILVGLLLVSLLVSGCSGGGQKPQAQQPQQSQGAQQPPGSESKVAMPSRITIGASEPGSSWYPMAAAMKDVLEREFPNLAVDIFYGGGDVNLKAIEEKKIDFGITFGVTAGNAIAGKGRFEKPLKNVSGAMGLYVAALQMVVRPESNINSIKDLKGKTISTGMPGYATTGMFEEILSLYGLSKSDVKWEYATVSDVAIMFKDRKVDFFAIHSPVRTPFPAIQDIATQTPIRLVGMEEDVLKKLMEMNPGHQRVVVPANLYRGQTQDVVTQGTVGILAVRSDLPNEVVYNVVSALIKNKDYLAKAVADLGYVSAENSPKGLGVPLHPGAEKYYKEQGTLK